MPSPGTVGTARILLAAVVLGTISTTITVAVTLPERAATEVEIPDLPPAPPTPVGAPAESPAAPVTGADIAAPVLEQERVGGVMSRREPSTDPATGATIPGPDDEIWGTLSDRMRESVRDACAEDRLDGPVCRQV